MMTASSNKLLITFTWPEMALLQAEMQRTGLRQSELLRRIVDEYFDRRSSD